MRFPRDGDHKAGEGEGALSCVTTQLQPDFCFFIIPEGLGPSYSTAKLNLPPLAASSLEQIPGSPLAIVEDVVAGDIAPNGD